MWHGTAIAAAPGVEDGVNIEEGKPVSFVALKRCNNYARGFATPGEELGALTVHGPRGFTFTLQTHFGATNGEQVAIRPLSFRPDLWKRLSLLPVTEVQHLPLESERIRFGVIMRKTGKTVDDVDGGVPVLEMNKVRVLPRVMHRHLVADGANVNTMDRNKLRFEFDTLNVRAS
jgi:hypothetical protein